MQEKTKVTGKKKPVKKTKEKVIAVRMSNNLHKYVERKSAFLDQSKSYFIRCLINEEMDKDIEHGK